MEKKYFTVYAYSVWWVLDHISTNHVQCVHCKPAPGLWQAHLCYARHQGGILQWSLCIGLEASWWHSTPQVLMVHSLVLTVKSLLFIVKSPDFYRKLSEKKWKPRPMTHDLQHPTPDKVTVHWPVAPAVSSRSAGTRASFAYHFDQTSVATPLGLTLPRESGMFIGFVQKFREHPTPMDDHHFVC